MEDLEFVNRPERFGQRGSVRPHRERYFADSSLEGAGFELSVPAAKEAGSKGAGLVCAPLQHASGLPSDAVEAENNRLQAKSSDSPGDCRRLRIACLAVYSIMFGAARARLEPRLSYS